MALKGPIPRQTPSDKDLISDQMKAWSLQHTYLKLNNVRF